MPLRTADRYYHSATAVRNDVDLAVNLGSELSLSVWLALAYTAGTLVFCARIVP